MINKKILVVDDYPLLRMVIQATLEDEGFAVQSATGQSALTMARQQPPDLILLDLRMPEVDGPEVRRRLLDDTRTAQVPVVVMSSESHIRRSAREMRAQACLPKPFNLEDLLNVVRRETHVA